MFHSNPFYPEVITTPKISIETQEFITSNADCHIEYKPSIAA